MTDLNFPQELAKVDVMIAGLRNDFEIVAQVDDWYTAFKSYYDSNFKATDGENFTSLSNMIT